MKKLILALAAVSLLTACKKEGGNQSVVKQENVTTNYDPSAKASDSLGTGATASPKQEYTYRYIAEDDSNAIVKFINTDKENSISVTSNKMTITAPQTESWAKGAIYKKDDIEMKSEGDILTITQGSNIIELRRAKGQ